MKIWDSYGSEHSMNLVLIGHFKEVSDASNAKEIIDMVSEQVVADQRAATGADDVRDRYSDGMRKVLEKVQVYSIAPTEFDQFNQDVRIEVDKSQMVITTDEIEVSAFMKVLLAKGARIEVYSAHDYPKTGHGRDTSSEET
jgi:hypothetical protein